MLPVQLFSFLQNSAFFKNFSKLADLLPRQKHFRPEPQERHKPNRCVFACVLAGECLPLNAPTTIAILKNH
jgi:hypothetical protein